MLVGCEEKEEEEEEEVGAFSAFVGCNWRRGLVILVENDS